VCLFEFVFACEFMCVMHPRFGWCVFINLSGLRVLIVLSVPSCVLRVLSVWTVGCVLNVLSTTVV